ncbi:MAG: Cupin domain protein [Mucilaginibacter sp.]|nr:Cupin domain protein [Mucilaginibacter sp.]
MTLEKILTKNYYKMEDQEQKHTAPKGFGPVAAQYFTGTARLKMRVVPDEITNCGIGEVIFEPGCRNTYPFTLVSCLICSNVIIFLF